MLILKHPEDVLRTQELTLQVDVDDVLLVVKRDIFKQRAHTAHASIAGKQIQSTKLWANLCEQACHGFKLARVVGHRKRAVAA